VRGPTIFSHYLNLPAVTAASFDSDGWFKTGDIAVFNYAKQSFRILGRASSDIIKVGGYKLSALEIERELLSHSAVKECAVIGVPDPVFGEALVALIVLNSNAAGAGAGSRQQQQQRQRHLPDMEADIQAFLAPRLAPYKRKFKDVLFIEGGLPRNAMGKINKKTLLKDLGC
jgi:malonyl-CoA/methylmalonyl-CoA synthetase